MFEARRLLGRLFYLLLSVLVALVSSQAQAPATTTISDVVYRADGTAAGGTLLISWPAFITSDAITNRQIVDEAKFKSGLAKVIDGTVDCLNASIWAKGSQP